MGGIILGALAGAADALLKNDAIERKAILERETHAANASLDSQLALNRSSALEMFKQTMTVNSANQQREAQVGRIDAAVGKIADDGAAVKRGIIGGGIADPSAWTPEQQAAVDQSIGIDRQKAMSDPKVRTQAAIQTGDISPEKAASLGQSADLAQMKYENLLARAEDKNATAKEIAEIRAEAARTAAEIRKNGGDISKEERLRYTSLFSESGRRLGEAQKALATLQKQPLYSMAEKGSQQAQELDDLRSTIKGYQEERHLYQNLLANSRTGPGPTDAPSPSSASSSGRPKVGGSESDLKPQISGGMGTSTAIIDENLQQIQEALKTAKDPGARADLQEQYADYQRQRARLVALQGPAAKAPGSLQAVPGKPVAVARALPLPSTKGELRTGAIYLTSRGPAKWNGSAFEAQ